MPRGAVLVPNREQGSQAQTENSVIFSTGCDYLTSWLDCDEEGENIFAELHEEEDTESRCKVLKFIVLKLIMCLHVQVLLAIVRHSFIHSFIHSFLLSVIVNHVLVSLFVFTSAQYYNRIVLSENLGIPKWKQSPKFSRLSAMMQWGVTQIQPL
jgi:hypothetical protein